MNKGYYIREHLKKFDRYIKDVETNKVTVSTWIKKAVRRHKEDTRRTDIEFRIDKARRVLEFFSFLNININNQYRQYILEPWLTFVLLSLFSWYYKDSENRRFTEGVLFIARKNSKTVFCVAVQLYGAIADGVVSAQSLLLANTREQAGIGLQYAKDIVANSPALNSRLVAKQYHLEYNYNGGVNILKTLASQAHRLDGYNPSMSLLDEMHEMPDWSLYQVIKSGTMSRKNPMMLIASTAGFNTQSPFYEMVELSKNVLNKTIKEDSLFAALFTLDENDNIKNPAIWIKSNPNLDKSVYLRNLESEFGKALNKPILMRNFVTKNLNVFTDEITAWVPNTLVKKQQQKISFNDFKQYGCYVGIDLSSTKDLTCLVFLFFIDNQFYAIPKFYSTERTDLNRKGGINLKYWIDAGHITKTKSQTIDFDFIFNDIREITKDIVIKSIDYDPFNSGLIIPKLEIELNIKCVKFPQTASNFNFPMKYIEKVIYDKLLFFDDNPLIPWNFSNVVLYQDGNGNIKPMKNKSKGPIDFIVALAGAMRGFINENMDTERIALENYNKSLNPK